MIPEPTPAERELAAKIYNDTLAPALHDGSPHQITRIAESLARHRQPAPVEGDQPASVPAWEGGARDILRSICQALGAANAGELPDKIRELQSRAEQPAGVAGGVPVQASKVLKWSEDVWIAIAQMAHTLIGDTSQEQRAACGKLMLLAAQTPWELMDGKSPGVIDPTIAAARQSPAPVDAPPAGPASGEAHPGFTVLYNIVSKENGKWIGTGWEFLNTREEAAKACQRLTTDGHCVTVRPYFDPCDKDHLGAVHRMAAAPARAPEGGEGGGNG